MSLLVKNNQTFWKMHISAKIMILVTSFMLKGTLIKVTYITPQEAVILLQKNLYVAKVVNMQTI